MKEKYLTGKWELSCLIINLIIYKVFTDAPRRFLDAGNSAFLAAVISALVAYGVIWFIPVIYEKTGSKNIFELLEKKGVASAVSGIVIFVWLALSASYALEALVTFSKIAAFPSAPFVFIALFFIAGMIAAVLRGMEGCIRPHGLIVPFCVFIILFMLSSVVRYFDITNLTPVFGKSGKNTILTAFKNLPYFFDFILVFLINPFLKDGGKLSRTVRISGALGILVNLLIILSANLLITYPAGNDIEFPVYQIMKSVWFGRFFQRIDALYLLSVSLSGMAYISFVSFLMTYSFKKAFKQRISRPFVWSFGFIVLFLAMLIHKGENANIYKFLMLSEGAGILLLILIPLICIVRREKK